MAEEKTAPEAQTGSGDANVNTETKNTNTNTQTVDGNGDGELKELAKDELVKIIHDTRAEAKTRRLKQRELEGQLSEHEKNKQLNEQMQLESKQEFEKAYTKLKDTTKDYDELKTFKQNYLQQCKDKIDEMIPTLTKAEQELFDISKEKLAFDEQITFIQKLKQTKETNIDNTQSTGRASDKQYTKEELLKDPALMAEVKGKNPTLYEKIFKIRP